jgi:hypothetical protein
VQEFEQPSENISEKVVGDNNTDVDLENRSFAEETAGLFDLLDKHTTDIDEAHRNLEEEKVSRFSTLSILVAGLALLIAYPLVKLAPTSFWLAFKSPMVVIQGILLIAYLAAIAYFISQVYSMKYYLSFFKNPTRESLKEIGITVQEETRLFKHLDGYSEEAISYISERLKYHHEAIGQFKSYFVGAIEKVGLVPGFIATVAAFVGALYGKNWIAIYTLSLGIGAIIGVYIVIAPKMFASIRTKKYGFVLEPY